MILPWKCSSSHFNSAIIFWISARIPNVVNPGKIFHSNSIGSPSIRSNSLKWRDSMNHLILFLPGSDGIWTDSSQTQHWIGKDTGFCCRELNCLVSKQGCPLPHLLLPIDHGKYSYFLSDPWSVSQLLETTCFNDFVGWFLVQRKFSEATFRKMNCSLKSDGHEYASCQSHSHQDVPLCLPVCDRISVAQSIELSQNVNVSTSFLRLCGQILPVPSLSEFPEATSFLILFSFSWKFMEFLVLLCRYASPRTLVQFLHLFATLESSTLHLDWSGSLAASLSCTPPTRLTSCPEYPRTFRRNWTLLSQRTCRSMRNQVQRRFWLCIVSGQQNELKFWAQQMKPKWLMLNTWRRLFHSSRVTFPFVNMLAFGVNVTNLDLGVKIILSNSQSKATL